MKIKDFLSSYEDGIVQISDNVTENQRKIIEKNHQMKSGKFENPYFEDGKTDKLYYNVVLGFCQTLVRGSKIRLSEFNLASLNGKWFKLLDILKFGLRHFLKYNGFANTRDELTEELVEMGHVLTKVVDGETTIVDLRNFVFKPDMKSAKHEGGAEKIYLSYEEAKAEYGDNKHWKEIKSHWEKIKDTESNLLTFIEYWTLDNFEVDGKKEITKGCIKYLDRSSEEPDQHSKPDKWEPQLEIDRFASPHKVKTRNKRDKKLYGNEMRVFPYDEERLIYVRGRYIGMGAFEICRPSQEDYNEKRNFKRKFDRLALRGILVHKIGRLRREDDAEALNQEFLDRMDTGAAAKIFSDESLERLNLGSMTSDVKAMTDDLFEFMRFLLGVTPIATGDDNSNKTAYYAMTQNQAQQTTYQYIKNRVANLFERLFQDFLIDDVIEEAFCRDVFTIYGDRKDLEELDRYLAEQTVYSDESIKSEEEADTKIESLIKEQRNFGDNRYINIKKKSLKRALKKLLKEIEFMAEFTFSETAIDPNSKIKTLIEADKITNKKIRDVVVDVVGVSPKLLEESDAEKKKRIEEEIALQGNAQIPDMGNITNQPATV